MHTRFSLLAALLLVSALTVLAAVAPPAAPVSGPSNASGGGAILLTTEKGLFVLRDGVLGKFELPTLKQVQTLEMFGNMPEPPKDWTDQKARQDYQLARQRRTAPAIMIAQGTSLIVVIGDGFARLSQDTLKMEASADLRPQTPDAADNNNPYAMYRTDPTPGYLLTDTTLYLMRTTELFAITTLDGKFTRATLSKELQPLRSSFGNQGGAQGGGRGGNGANGAGGGRGNGGNNANGAAGQ
jgi:uncharacterized membrane protein YgcG